MAKHFASASDWMKKRTFPTLTPVGYNPNITSEHLNLKKKVRDPAMPWKITNVFERSPIPYIQDDGLEEMLDTSCSPEVLINMFRRKINYTVINDSDMPEILEGIDRYLLSIKTDVDMNNEPIIEYAKIVIEWRREVYKHYFRFMKQNQNAMNSLYPNGNPKSTVFSLLSMIDPNNKQTGYNPLRDKSHPPYEINPPVKIQLPTDGGPISENYLGVSEKLATQYDDGKDFNFDDFLGGR